MSYLFGARGSRLFLKVCRPLSKRLIQRAACSAVLLLLLSLASFTLLRLMPGDFAEVLLMSQMDGNVPSAAALAKFSADHGFDRPMPVQYLNWLGGLLSGDLGHSLVTGEPVGREILLRLGSSLELAAAAIFLSMAIAIPLALAAVRFPNGLTDRLCMALSVVAMSIPNFWYALLLALLFSLVLGWLPSSGHGSWLQMVLPVVVIGTSVAGVSTRYIRGLLLDEAGRPYMRTAAAKGVGPLAALIGHAWPNALPSVLTLAGLQFARVFDGIIVVEVLFVWPGIGRLLVESLMARDFPVIQACFLIIGTVYVITHLLVDVVIALLDPRGQEAI